MTVSARDHSRLSAVDCGAGGPGLGSEHTRAGGDRLGQLRHGCTRQRRRDRDEGVHPHYGVEPSHRGRSGSRSRRSARFRPSAPPPASRWSVGRRKSVRRTSPITRSLTRLATNYPVSPTIGVGPAPVIASDNTLGAYSQFQGELYVAFVGHSLATATTSVTSNSNPASNTDIYLITSTNGGSSWSIPGPGRPGQRGDGRVLRGEYGRRRGHGDPDAQHQRPHPVHAVDRRGSGHGHARGELVSTPATMRRTRATPRT